MIEAIEDITEGRRTQFGSFLNKSGCRWMISVIRESVDQFVASTSGALSDQELHEYICWQLPASGEVAGIGNVVLDVVGDKTDSILELSQDVVMRHTGTSFKCVNGGNQFHHLKGPVH